MGKLTSEQMEMLAYALASWVRLYELGSGLPHQGEMADLVYGEERYAWSKLWTRFPAQAPKIHKRAYEIYKSLP